MAVLYLADNGCKWRNLPHDFPPYSTVHSFARISGLWDRILQYLIEVTRKKAVRNPNPTYAIIDSQSIDTAYASEQVGFDGGKKTKDTNVRGCIHKGKKLNCGYEKRYLKQKSISD